MQILITDRITEEGIEYLNQQTGFEINYRPGLTSKDLLLNISHADALIVRSRTKVTSEVIKSSQALKVIGRAGAGVDNIDIDTATNKGIVVMNTPGGNSVSVAEHVFALLLSLVRKIPTAQISLKSGNWDPKQFVGQELQNKTFGIIGLGKIGAIVAQLAHSFHMRVIAFDPFVSKKYAADLGVELADLEKLLSQCDFVSLHLPLNDKTIGIICEKTLNLMKKNSFLINTSRGPLVVEEDLAVALEKGNLAGTALDVFEKEPEVNPVLRFSDRTVLTPHIAGSTVEAQTKVGYEIAVQVANYLQHEIIANAVNFPSLDKRELEHLQPYLQLGKKLGSFLGQTSQLRISKIGLHYYGDLTQINHKPVSNYILKAILQHVLSEEVNEINARSYARERGILLTETVNSRQRSYSNLIRVQLQSSKKAESIEGAILHRGNLRLIAVDNIPVEAPLGRHVLMIRNSDQPGVIGQVGMVLGNAQINIASFVLGRDTKRPHAIGIVNTDETIPEKVLDQIRSISAVQFAQIVHL